MTLSIWKLFPAENVIVAVVPLPVKMISLPGMLEMSSWIANASEEVTTNPEAIMNVAVRRLINLEDCMFIGFSLNR